MSPCEPPVHELARLLDLVPTASGEWTGSTPLGGDRGNLFGGIVAAQALRAAQQSVPSDRHAHSLHAYFLRAGRPGESLRFLVDETRDGRSFSVRRVEVHQSGGAILTMIASFQVPEPGHDYEIRAADVAAPVPGAPTLPTAHSTGTGGDGPFELIELEAPPPEPGSMAWTCVRHWTRVRGTLGDDPALHACAVVAMADLRTGGAPRMARSGSSDWVDGEVTMTSIDYAFWFRRPAFADRWLLFDLRAGGNSGARGLTSATIHDESGRHIASYAMEMLMRERSTKASGDASLAEREPHSAQ